VTHHLLVLSPDAVNRSPHQGRHVTMTFEEFVRFVDAPLVRERKDQDGGISLGRFREGIRRLTHFEASSLVGLDYDDGRLSPEQFHQMLGGSEHVVYPTFSVHAETGIQKCRAILTLDREVDLETHRRIMWAIYARATDRGFALDRACKDATRWWFTPVVHPDRAANYVVYRTPPGAAPMSVAALLQLADRLDAAEESRRQEWARAHPPAGAHVHKESSYITAALDRAATKVARATPGNRHEALNCEAYSLARLELLSEEDVASVLVPAFVAASGPGREREARRTVADAFKARGR
jgi:hypothetical protein